MLFGIAELLQWFKQFSLPLPVFIVGGVFLAAASNYDKFDKDKFDKFTHLPFPLDSEEPKFPQKQVASDQAIPEASTTMSKAVSRSISFEIRKPFQARD